MSTEYAANFTPRPIPDVLKTYPIPPRHGIPRFQRPRTSHGITAKNFKEFQEHQNKKRSEVPAVNQAMHEQDLLELEKEAELKELTQSLHIESQAFNKSRQNKKNVPLPLKTPNFENVSFERSKTTNFVLKDRPDSSEKKRSENTIYKSIIIEQMEAEVAKKVDSEQREAVDNCLARFHAEQECKSQKRRDFDYYLKRRENTKLQLEKQMKIPVVTVPFAYEDATQIFGLTPEQQVRKDSNLSNNILKNSVSNKLTSYETMLANIQKKKQVRLEEAMVLDKIQRDMTFDVSNRMKRNQSIKVKQTQVLMKQMALRRSKTDAEIRMMGMKSDTPFGCKMMELRRRPDPRPKSSLWNDWQNHRKLPCII